MKKNNRDQWLISSDDTSARFLLPITFKSNDYHPDAEIVEIHLTKQQYDALLKGVKLATSENVLGVSINQICKVDYYWYDGDDFVNEATDEELDELKKYDCDFRPAGEHFRCSNDGGITFHATAKHDPSIEIETATFFLKNMNHWYPEEGWGVFDDIGGSHDGMRTVSRIDDLHILTGDAEAKVMAQARGYRFDNPDFPFAVTNLDD